MVLHPVGGANVREKKTPAENSLGVEHQVASFMIAKHSKSMVVPYFAVKDIEDRNNQH